MKFRYRVLQYENSFMKKLIYKVIVSFFLLFVIAQTVSAQENQPKQTEVVEGKVVEILQESQETRDGQDYLFQQLKVTITKGDLKDEIITIESGNIPLVNQQKYKVGDELLINSGEDLEGNRIFYIVDFIRRKPLGILLALFIILTIAIGRLKGIFSLIGLTASFVVIFSVILPLIDRGMDPIIVAIGGSVIIALTTFYLSHGVNKKTTIAIISTLLTLLITGVLARIFTDLSSLTGFTSDEVSFLQVAKGGTFNVKGLLLAGIIIGSLGILDDITISQAAIVGELKKANPRLTQKELFLQAMVVGREHIASLVNTLILVYTGSALPLLLLFIDSSRTFSEVINYEPIAEEIIRTLTGSIGLIFAVPITTLIAAKFTADSTRS